MQLPQTIGEVKSFRIESTGRTFEVKRLQANVWHLRDTAIRTRSRFGTESEIAADVETVLASGMLPPPARG